VNEKICEDNFDYALAQRANMDTGKETVTLCELLLDLRISYEDLQES